jgi:hypothetical protein
MIYPFRFTSFLCLSICGSLAGCGDDLFSESDTSSYHQPESEWRTSAAHPQTGLGGRATLSGSVVSAFQITVDDVRYEDSEDFYSQEVERLSQKVGAAGYAGWEARFEAVVGFTDLAQGMKVYVAPTTKNGFSGEVSVGSDGKFRVDLPQLANNNSYKIRAVKRVNVVLSRGGEERKFCYNLSAVEKSVELTATSMPVLLDTFQTQFTLYACEAQSNQAGVQIPASTGLGSEGRGTATGSGGALTSSQAAILERISVGESAESVVQKWSDPASIVRESPWSYYNVPSYDRVWKYLNFPGNSVDFNCRIFFQGARLVAYDECPASRINFAEGSLTAPAKPSSRIAAGSSFSTVLNQWGLPTIVSLTEYSGVCQLNWLAHWTF